MKKQSLCLDNDGSIIETLDSSSFDISTLVFIYLFIYLFIRLQFACLFVFQALEDKKIPINRIR